MNPLIPVIMCGGSGTRMWPLSRSHYPKQFIKITDDHLSMLQLTINRTESFSKPGIFISNEKHQYLIADQLEEIHYQPQTVILEPCSKNTAPAIALAALTALNQEQDPLLLVLPADHVIKDESKFCEAVLAAKEMANDGMLVTFGIVPSYPETGYGYIRCGDYMNQCLFHVDGFVEKPNKELAEKYMNSGRYLWNSGMFLFKASTYLNELEKHAPEIMAVCRQSIATQSDDGIFSRVDQKVFEQCLDESIDCAVMEKTDKAAVMALDVGWSDIGSWASAWELHDKDEQGNSFKGDVLSHNSNNCLVQSTNRLVSLVGVDDVVVIETSDAVLVADKNNVQDIKSIVGQLKEKGRNEHNLHRQVFRPWGKFDSIDSGQRFQVKHITVKAGEQLSRQMHHHRAEHWIVVSGTAKVSKGDETFLLTENQSTYIPIGEEHSLENPGKVVLELIEVQSGAYLGEDDIVRFTDKYGRH